IASYALGSTMDGPGPYINRVGGAMRFVAVANMFSKYQEHNDGACFKPRNDAAVDGCSCFPGVCRDLCIVGLDLFCHSCSHLNCAPALCRRRSLHDCGMGPLRLVAHSRRARSLSQGVAQCLDTWSFDVSGRL